MTKEREPEPLSADAVEALVARRDAAVAEMKNAETRYEMLRREVHGLNETLPKLERLGLVERRGGGWYPTSKQTKAA